MIASFPQPKNAIAITTFISSSCFYIAYRNHDQRKLSQDEVAFARGALAHITPSSSSSSSTSSTSSSSSSAAISQHLSNLNKYGATVVTNTLNPSQLVQWRKRANDAFNGDNVVWNSGRAHCCISKHSSDYLDMTRVGSSSSSNDDDDDDGVTVTHDTIIDRKKSNYYSWFSGPFRRKNSNDDLSTTKATPTTPTSSLQDVVNSYFTQHGIARYELTDLQYLNALPNSSSCCTNQIWHRDNKFMGLTAIVALCDVRSNGPTELMVGSHRPDFTLWERFWDVLVPSSSSSYYSSSSSNNDKEGGRHMNNGGDDDVDSFFSRQPLLLGCIDAGDTILYDARIFHRGRGNTDNNENNNNTTLLNNGSNVEDDEGGSSSNDRPVLVLRWDAARTPPPGAGLIVTTANIYIGSMMYAALFAMQKISTAFDRGDKNK